MPTDKPRAPLDGVLVLDLSRAVTGPYCTMMLADLGARVLKIEEPEGGDETRRWGPPFVGGESTYFLSVNRGKESVAIDLKDPAGLDAVLRIAAKADVMIENFRPGVADRLGLGHERLRELNPKLIYASISGFGQTGPYRERPGYDLMMQALSGFMRLSAMPGGPPVKSAFPVADTITGMFAANAILASLYERECTGHGRYIEVSLLESMMAAMAAATTWHLVTGEEPPPMGLGQANIVPYQVFSCPDGQIIIGAPNEKLWRRFCDALERPDWPVDPRYRDNAARNLHRAELVADIERTLAKRSAAEWIEILESHELPCAPIATMTEALAHEQLAARGSIVESRHPKLGVIRLVGSPMRMEGYEPDYPPPPMLGQHTGAVLREFQ